MEREILKTKLLNFGYSYAMVKKLLQGTSQPTVEKIFILEDEFNIPVNAWRDIKSYLQENDTKTQSTQTSAQHTEEVS